LSLAKALRKPFAKASRQDMVDLVAEIEANDSWAAWTKQHYKVTLKKFYKWLRGYSDPGQYPEEVSWIRTTVKMADSMLPDQVLTEDEVRRMAEVAINARDKAMVLVLYESGCRVGEIVPLQIKNVALDQHGAVLMVTGKTGARRVRIIGAVPALAGWLQIHPARDDPNSPLWVNLATNLRGQPLGYRGFFQVFKYLAKQAGIKKHVNPKALRHARATFLANHLSDAQMRQLFGWTQASKMTAVYVHLSGRDVDNALLQLHGLAPRGTDETKLKVTVCPRCSEKNSPDAIYCGRCALPLDPQAVQWEDRAMDGLLKNPAVRRVLEKMITKGKAA
jgi:site-specific recombinase XerD